MWAKQQRQGFTIVELLIVIAIVGLLAALTVIAFQGVQKRAQNTRTIANVRQFYSSLEIYKVNTGIYPLVANPEDTTSVKMVCVGIGYVGATCGKITGTIVNESPDFYLDIQTNSTGVSKDIVNIVDGSVGDEDFIGAAYGIDTLNIGGMGRVIEWFLSGPNADCGVANSYSYNTDNDNTACEVLLEKF